jgi:hypothetical protein
MTKSFEERFDDGCNTDNISDPPSDREWIKSFIRQEKELSRREERRRITHIINNWTWVNKSVEALLQKINQEDK